MIFGMVTGLSEVHMLNYIWAFMILGGLAYGVTCGQAKALSDSIIDSSGEAVSLAITMLGVMAMWCGIMEVAKQSGLMDKMTRFLSPAVRFLFPEIDKNHIVNEYITANMVANMLGLGWAATPMGLKAIKEMAKIERERLAKKNVDISKVRLKASNEMCTFLVINISSLQLIPVNIIAYRSQYGSVNPVGIVVPGLIATGASTLVAVIFCRIMSKVRKKNTI